MCVEEEKSSKCEFHSHHAQRFLRIVQIASNTRDNEKRKGSVNDGVDSMSCVRTRGSCMGVIDPSKGRVYNVYARQGFMKVILELQRVDVLDGD